MIIWSNLSHFAAMLTYLYVTNRATKYKNKIQKLENNYQKAQDEESQYTFLQMATDGFYPFLYSILYMWECGCGEKPIEFTNYYKGSKFAIAVLGKIKN